MTSQHIIAPDTTKRTGEPPSHFHCYKWSSSGQQWANLGRTDTLDLNSPDRPPVRTSDWLIKSPRFIAATYVNPVQARDWLLSEWEKACERPMNPVPEWVDLDLRAERALRAIETGCWPSWSQWVAGGSIVLMAVVGTPQACH